MCKTEEECDEWLIYSSLLSYYYLYYLIRLLSIRKCIENAKSKGGEDNHDIDKIEKVYPLSMKFIKIDGLICINTISFLEIYRYKL